METITTLQLIVGVIQIILTIYYNEKKKSLK